MARWKRTKDKYLTKSRSMPDGEILHLLVADASHRVTDLDERIYASLEAVRSSTNKAAYWVLGASAFGILAHFRVLKGISTSGFDVAPTIFFHAALATLSIAAAAFCFSFCNQTFIQSWFAWKFKQGTSSLRAELLLRFPDAYFYFVFLPANIGLPKHIHANRKNWPQLASLILILIALIIFSIGSLMLWGVLIADVWYAQGVGRTLTVLTIGFSVTLALIGWMAPFYYEFPRSYTHYGLVNLLTKMEGEDLRRAHLRLHRVASRMGLVDLAA